MQVFAAFDELRCGLRYELRCELRAADDEPQP
jgi:hypothetical protein